MVPSLTKLIGLKNGLFLQDNAPIHNSKICKKFLENEKIKIIQIPPNSPDLNPIENLWKEINTMCKERECKNENELFEVVKDAWEQIDKKYLESLVQSMPQRIQAVIKEKGRCTKY